MRRLAVIIVLLIAFVASACQEGRRVTISLMSPAQNAEVGLSEIVKGKASDPSARIYVIVHPLLTNLWWVQRIPSPPNADGSFQTLCYFGTETKGVGESFEIAAIVTNKTYVEGQILKELSKNAGMSDIVTVRRTK